MIFVLVLAIASLGFAVYLIGDAATAPARERHGSIRRAANYGKSRRRSTGRPEETFGARVVEPLKIGLAQGVLKISPRMTADAVTARALAPLKSLLDQSFSLLKTGAVGLFVSAVAILLADIQRAYRSTEHAPVRWRLAAVVVLAVTVVTWLLWPDVSGYVGGTAWFLLLFLPALACLRSDRAGEARPSSRPRRVSRLRR